METLQTLAKFLEETTTPFTDPIGKPLGVLTKPLYDGIDNFALSIGFDSPSVIYLSCFVLSLPLALIHRKLPLALRNFWSAFWGLCFSFFSFQWGTLHPIASALICYFISAVLPHTISHRINLVIAFGYCCVVQIWRMHVDYLGWSLDFSTLQMLLTLKIISFSFNVSDGQKIKKGIKLNTEDHKNLAVGEFPSLLEYFGYLFFYPGVVSGPVYELAHYRKWSKNTNLKCDPLKVLKNILWALFLMVLTAAVLPTYGRQQVIKPDVNQYSWWFLIVLIFYVPFYARVKYQLAWYWAEAGFITAGFGWSEGNKRSPAGWNNIGGADYLQLEIFSSSIQTLTNNWNKSVSRFLRHYIYTRIGDSSSYERTPEARKKSKLLNLVATFVFSATWHGFYPGYYVLFVMTALVSNAHKMWVAKVKSRIFSEEDNYKKPKQRGLKYFIYKLISWVASMYYLNAFAMGFIILDWNDTVYWFQRTQYIPVYLTLAYVLFLTVLPPPKRKIK